MTAHRERVFEYWVASGDDATFEEWCAAKRERAEQYRQQKALHDDFRHRLMASPNMTAQLYHVQVRQHAQLQQQQMFAQEARNLRLTRGLSGLLGGLLG